MARRTRQVAVRPARLGFTLVELLVVISIIGMLAALLLPAVNQAREAGRKTTCLNNQKQIALGIIQYEQRQNFYPGYVNPQAIMDNKHATRPVGWMFTILPYLERTDLYDNYGTASLSYNPRLTDPNGNWTATVPPNVFLKIATCPSDTRAETANASSMNENMTALSYVVNCGLKDQDPPTILRDSNDNPLSRDWPANGVFHYNYPYTNNSFPSFPNEYPTPSPTAGTGDAPSEYEKIVKVSSSLVSSSDGMATTLMLSENVDSNNWTNIWETQIGFIWQAGLDASNNQPGPGPCPLGDNLQVNLKRINQDVGLIDSAGSNAERQAFARPSSYHPGGVNATFCDGHVQFIAETIDYLVYCQLMTPRGKAAQPAPTPSTASSGNFPPFFSLRQSNPNLAKYGTATLSEGSY